MNITQAGDKKAAPLDALDEPGFFYVQPSAMGYGNSDAFYPPKDLRLVNLARVQFVEHTQSGVRLHIGHTWFEYAWGEGARLVSARLGLDYKFEAPSGDPE